MLEAPPNPRVAALPRVGLFTADHEELRGYVREFVQRALAPHAEEWERAGEFPVRETFAAAGHVGLFGAKYEPTYGGTGPDLVADAVITEELTGCGSGGVAAALGAHKDLGSYYLYRFGSEDQRRRWLRPAVDGSLVTALAVTEPGAGSDVGAIRTRAVRRGDGWVIEGSKAFITNGPIADVIVVAAKTDPDAGRRGISLFVVAPGTVEGWSRSRISTTRIRASCASPPAIRGWRSFACAASMSRPSSPSARRSLAWRAMTCC